MLPNRPGYKHKLTLRTSNHGYIPPVDPAQKESVSKLKQWAKTQAKFVDQGEEAVLFSSKKKGLYTTNVKCCIAVTLTAYNFQAQPIDIAMGHYDNVSQELPIAFLATKLIKYAQKIKVFIRTISIKLFGGHTQPSEISALSANAYRQVRSVLRNKYTLTKTEFIFNPYKVTPEVENYEKEFDILGYSLNVGLTPKGQVVIAFDSISMEYSTSRMAWLQSFINGSLHQLRVIANTCKSDKGINDRINSLFAAILKEDKWVSSVVEKKFKTSYQRFQKYLSS